MGELNYRYFLAFLLVHAAFFSYCAFYIFLIVIGDVYSVTEQNLSTCSMRRALMMFVCLFVASIADETV